MDRLVLVYSMLCITGLLSAMDIREPGMIISLEGNVFLEVAGPAKPVLVINSLVGLKGEINASTVVITAPAGTEDQVREKLTITARVLTINGKSYPPKGDFKYGCDTVLSVKTHDTEPSMSKKVHRVLSDLFK